MTARPVRVKDNPRAHNPPNRNTSEGFKEFSHYARVIAICGRCKTVYVGYVAVPVLQIEEPYPSEEEAFINFHTRCPRDGALLNWTINVRRKEED
jgi:hypothetical protein